MTFSIAEYALGVQMNVLRSCEEGHVHAEWGTAIVMLRWYYSEPTTIFAFANVDPFTGEAQEEFVFGRDLLMTALRSGTSAGFPVIGEGNVTLKVNSEMAHLISFRFNGGFTFLAHRDALTEWITGTYQHVPYHREEMVLDIDATIQQLLNS
jgi:hypothetical protein